MPTDSEIHVNLKNVETLRYVFRPDISWAIVLGVLGCPSYFDPRFFIQDGNRRCNHGARCINKKVEYEVSRNLVFLLNVKKDKKKKEKGQ